MTNALDRLNHLADRWTPRIVVSVIAAAFILSYAALLALAIEAGYHPLLAWLWPLVLDRVVISKKLILTFNLESHIIKGSFTPESEGLCQNY